MPPLGELIKFAPELEAAIEELPLLERGIACGARALRGGDAASGLIGDALRHLPKLELGLAKAGSIAGAASRDLSEAAGLDMSMVKIPSATYDDRVLQPYYRVVPANSNDARVFAKAIDSAVHISGPNMNGSGILVGPERFIATAEHVVEDAKALYQVHITGYEPMQARVVAMDPSADLALLKLKGNVSIGRLPEPAELRSYWDMNRHDRAFVVSRPTVDGLYSTDGRVARLYSVPYVNDPPPAGSVTSIARVGYTNEGFPGASGAGVYADDGRVFAISTHMHGDNSLSLGTAADHLQALLDTVRQQGNRLRGWITLQSRALFCPIMGDSGPVERFDGVISTDAWQTSPLRRRP